MNKRNTTMFVSVAFLLCLGAPPASSQVHQPASITYVDSASREEIYNFTVKENAPSNLYVNYFDGQAWHWADQGLPVGISTLYFQTPSAVTYSQGDGSHAILAFVVGPNGHLYVNYSSGSAWNWADHGLPPGSTSVNVSSTITYADAAGRQQIYAFVVTANGHLATNYWNGSVWSWADLGPPGSTRIASGAAVGATTYADAAGQQHISVFAPVADGQLYMDHWDGTQWIWSIQGLPSGTSYVYGPSPVTYIDPNGNRVIFCFVAGGSGHLYVNYFDGRFWHWADQGLPPALRASVRHRQSLCGAGSSIRTSMSSWQPAISTWP